ncbi:hypothetical protein CDD80_4876 [Ophiocordyceps camponoti-rufipedis]|uniref:Methyltransferase domain-containing protein n=1 Tax=Ophiocordyceps camponoti-rufipedis TaxID=2004952 RepID=A0A2C5ZHS9_9HYPO|nr:hypothetical protein CDD80_4876 [Ophiocordyceps camponoti-rufipedis]
MMDAHVFVGDQADSVFLDQFVANATADGLFDLVIDDGGHTMKQQITSLERLWPVVKPGGLYVIEDLQTSYWPEYGGVSSTTDTTKFTTMNYLRAVLDDLVAKKHTTFMTVDLLSMDCMQEICALKKA